MPVTRRQFMAALATTGLGLWAQTACSSPPEGADLIFIGGPILTIAPGPPEVEALAITAGKITKVGDRHSVLAQRGTNTTIVDLHGRTLLPAFVEPHSHPFEMGTMLTSPAIDVRPFKVPTAQGVLTALTQAIEVAQPNNPILLTGIDPLLQVGLPHFSRTRLDRLAPHNPLIILTDSGYAGYANSAALQAAGITHDTPNPSGGQFRRDTHGKLDGTVFGPPALLRLISPFQGTLLSHAENSLNWAYTQFARAGITTASEHAYNSQTQRALFTKLANSPECPVRIRAYEIGTEQLANDPTHVRGKYAGAHILFDKIGIKLWADGSPWQGNIFTTFPYLTNTTTKMMGLGPHHRGALADPPEKLQHLIDQFSSQYWQISCHAYGDGAIDTVLDMYQQSAIQPVLRPRIEHAGAMRPDQCLRAKELGVSTSFLIQQVYFWGECLVNELFGHTHGSQWMPAGSAHQSRMRFSFHNDGPSTPPHPLGNIATAVNRTTKTTHQLLAPDQRVDIDIALRAQTLHAAWMLGLDREIGSLEPGKYADLVILAANPRQTPPHELAEIPVEATFLMGKQTYGTPLI